MGKAKPRGKGGKDPASEGENHHAVSNGTSSSQRIPPAENRATHETGRSTRKELPKPIKKNQKKKPIVGLNSAIGAVCAVILAVGGYFMYLRIQERRVVTPFAGALIPHDRSYKNGLLWGTYRPGVYFGVRSRTPDSVEMGLMWFSYNAHQLFLRHLCDQNDRLRYGWQQHDGRTFGYQEIIDDSVNISTTFVKRVK